MSDNLHVSRYNVSFCIDIAMYRQGVMYHHVPPLFFFFSPHGAHRKVIIVGGSEPKITAASTPHTRAWLWSFAAGLCPKSASRTTSSTAGRAAAGERIDTEMPRSVCQLEPFPTFCCFAEAVQSLPLRTSQTLRPLRNDCEGNGRVCTRLMQICQHKFLFRARIYVPHLCTP